MYPNTPAPAPAAPDQPVAQPVAPVVPQEPVHVQGTPHPGVMTPLGVDTQQAAAAAAAIQRQADAAATQLPPDVSPEAANVASRTAAVNAREIAAAMGFTEAARFQNDQQFMEAVLAQAQAGAQAQAQLQAIQQHQAAAYQAQAAAQQAAAQAEWARGGAQQPAARRNPIWNPPEYDPQWETMVTRDPATGAIAPVPGIPQEIASKLMAYRAYRQQFAEKFMADPEATLMPLIQQTAREQAAEMIRSELAQQQNTQYIEGFVQQNSSWLHQTDQNGRAVVNPQTGRPVLSPAGARFQQHVIAAANAGVADVRQQEAFARTALQNDILRSQYQHAQAQQQAYQAVQGANRRPNQGGMIPQGGVAAPPMTGMSLQQQLALAMAQAGMTDAMIDANLG